MKSKQKNNNITKNRNSSTKEKISKDYLKIRLNFEI